MTTNPELALEVAARLAEQMEIDGKAYYLALAKKSPNKRGQELFCILAAEEDQHRADFRRIYEAIAGGRPIPPEALAAHETSRVKTVFCQSAENLEKDIQAPASEIEAIDVAIQAEQKSIDFYQGELKTASTAALRHFFEQVIREERSHQETLRDYRAYILDPDGWLVSKSLPIPGGSFVPDAKGSASESEW